MIPPPPKQHRLTAAVSRFATQLTRTNSYFQRVRQALPQGDADPDVQYFFQTIVLMLHTFLEEYYKHLIRVATFWQPDPVRDYLMSRYREQAEQIEELAVAQLSNYAANQVNFRNHAAKLRGILGVLITAPPFADAEAESKCLDLVRIRNVITHQGGQPDAEAAQTIESPDVILGRETGLAGTFYQLHINERFMRETLTSLGRSVQRIETALTTDARYSI
jgi:hypothetical protein